MAPTLLTEEKVYALYVGLYDKIRTALDEAKTQGKSLAILIAEEHDNLNSCFLEGMIFDICERLEIRHFGLEKDQRSLAPIKNGGQEIFIGTGRNATSSFAKKLHLSNRVNEFTIDLEEAKVFFMGGCSPAFQLIPVPVDPKHSQRIKGEWVDSSIGDDVERPMVDEITKWAAGKNCVCCLGSLHAPYVNEHIKDIKNLSVLPINCCTEEKNPRKSLRVIALGAMQQSPSISLTKGVGAETVRELIRREREVTKYYSPALAWEPQIPLGVGLRMMLAASTRHKLEKSEIEPAVATQMLRQIGTANDQSKVRR